MRVVGEQRGFTLIELLVAMALALVVFSVTLDVLDRYTNQWNGSTERLDAQDKARLAIDRITRQLRNIASPLTSPKLLERATSYDIVFQTVGTPNGSNTTGAERVRYCIPQDTTPGSSADEVLYAETQTWSTATPPADPWSSDATVSIPCPDNPLPAGVDSTKNPVVLAYGITNRYQGQDRHAFSFNNTTDPSPNNLSQIYTVQVDLFVNPTPKLPNAETELRSGAFLRNQPRAPVASFTPTYMGGGGVLLNGGTSYSPDGEDLSYSWTCTTPSCPDASALTNSNQGLVDWQPGSGTYTVTLTVTDQTGLTGTTGPQQVTVP